MSNNPANTNLIVTSTESQFVAILSLGTGMVPVISQSGQTTHSVSSSLTVPPTQGVTLQASAPSCVTQSQQSKWSSQQSTFSQRSETEQLPGTPAGVTYSYMIKFINPKRKSDYTIRTWYDTSEKFTTIDNC